MSARPIPEGYHTVTPYLITSDAAGAIDYYRRAFGAKELMRLASPDGKVGHAEVQIGDSRVMLADEFPEMGARGPQAFGGTPVMLAIYVEDVDAVFQQAISAGGKEIRAVQDQFYGDRSGMLADPYGHIWTIATHTEDVPPEEITRRFAAAAQQTSGSH